MLKKKERNEKVKEAPPVIMPTLKVNRLEEMPAGLRQRFFGDKEEPDITRDFDAVGFAADHCLVKFNMKVWLPLLVQGHLDELHDKWPGAYPAQVKKFDFKKHMGLFMNCVVWDIENGTLLKLAGDDKQVTHALLGF